MALAFACHTLDELPVRMGPVSRASLLLVPLVCALACIDSGNDAPAPGLSDADVREACGDYAVVDELQSEQIIGGNCRIQSRRQVELFNSFEVTQILGTLELVLAPDELDDVSIERLERARQVRIGPGANVLAVRLPVLEALEGLTVRLNERLVALSAPSLSEVSRVFVVSENAALPTCDAEAVLSQLTTPPGEVLVAGNCERCCNGDR